MALSESKLQKQAMKNKAASFGARCMANGGQTQAPAKRQGEGLIEGPGTGTSDSIPIDLPSGSKIAASKHEFIIPADSTAKIGADNLQKMVDATHTPVNKPKSRFGMFDGGPSPLFNELAAEVQRDRIGGPKGLFFGSGNSAQVFTPGAPGSSVLGTSAIPPAAFGGFTHATPTSIASGMPALPSLATPGVPQYGGMGGGAKIINAGPSVSAPILGDQFGYTGMANGGYAHRTKKYDQTGCAMADGGPVMLSPADKDRMLSLANGGMAGYPQTVMAGMANGGRVKMADGTPPGWFVRPDGTYGIAPRAAPAPNSLRGTGASLQPDGTWQDIEAPPKAPLSPEPAPAGTKFFDPKAVRQPLPNASTGYAADGTMKAETLMAQREAQIAKAAPQILNEATGSAAGVADKAKGIFGRGASAVKNIGESLNPDITLGSLGKVAKLGLAAAPAIGGYEAASQTLPQHDAFARSVGADETNPATAALDFLAKTGNAATYGLAGRLGQAGSDAWNTPGGMAAKAAAFGKGFVADPVSAAAPSTQSSVPSTKIAGNGSSFGPPSPQAEPAPFSGPDGADARGALVRAGDPNGGTTALGDYGVPGTKIFGRSTTPGGSMNDFAGSGPTASSSNGITLGITPEQMAAYRAGSGGSNFGYSSAPQYQENPDVSDLSAKSAALAKTISSMGPGTMGRKSAMARLAAMTGALDALRGGDAQKNAFNQQTYGNQVGQFGHMLGYQGQLATNQVARQSAKYNYDAKMAEVDNQKYKQSVDEAQQRLTNENPRIEALAGGDKALADSLKVYTAARPFPVIDPKTGRQAIGPDGKPVTKGIQDLPADDKAKAYGIISLMAKKAAALKAVGKPYSLADMDRHTDAGVFGTAYSAVTSPYKTFKFGARTTNDNFLTAEPNTFDTDEEAEADRQQRGGR